MSSSIQLIQQICKNTLISTLDEAFSLLLYRRPRAKQTFSASAVTKKHLKFIYCCYIQWCFLSLSLCDVLELWGWWNCVNVVQCFTELTVSSTILAACSNTQDISPRAFCALPYPLSTNKMQKLSGGHWHIYHVTRRSGCVFLESYRLWATTAEILDFFFFFSQWHSSTDCIHKWLLLVKSSSASHFWDGELLVCWAHCHMALLPGTTCAGTMQLGGGWEEEEEGACFPPPGWSLHCMLQVRIGFEKDESFTTPGLIH